MSLFLAQLLGVYFVVIGLAVLINTHTLIRVISEFSESPALIFFSGVAALIFGLLIVLTHNRWDADWRLVVTLIGWLSLIKGVVRLCLPEMSMRMLARVSNPNTIRVMSVGIVALGCYLGYYGFGFFYV